jgi:hypothetical protein
MHLMVFVIADGANEAFFYAVRLKTDQVEDFTRMGVSLLARGVGVSFCITHRDIICNNYRYNG